MDDPVPRRGTLDAEIPDRPVESRRPLTGIVFLVGAVLVLLLIVAYAMWPSSHTGGSSATTEVVQPSPD
jgi:hypothetical protein